MTTDPGRRSAGRGFFRGALVAPAVVAAALILGCVMQKPFSYLGIPETEGRVLGDQAGNRIKVTKVDSLMYAQYESYKRGGMVTDEIVHDGYVYYSLTNVVPRLDSVSAQYPNGRNYTLVIERYRSKLETAPGP